MGKLSVKKYAWRCVLGTEVIYFACLSYGLFLSGDAQKLHRSLFELFPGFHWGSFAGAIWLAIFFAVAAWVFGWYIVWMHNSSLEEK